MNPNLDVPNSPYGVFEISEEGSAARQVQAYLRDQLGLLLPAYDAAVQNPERRLMARGILKTDADPAWVLRAAADLLYFAGQQKVADAFGLLTPLYNSIQDFKLNARTPAMSPPPTRPHVEPRWPFLGRLVGFPLGVPASALTGSRAWIQLLAESGYNVMTFKTVRSRAHQPFRAPNWVVLPNLQRPLDPKTADLSTPVIGDVTAAWEPGALGSISTANSFGVPSPDPDVWVPEVRATSEHLRLDEQMLIVSVLGDHYRTADNFGTPAQRRQELIEDFVRVALLAQDGAGASAIELNVSCPNTLLPDGVVRRPLCEDDPTLTVEIAHAVRQALHPDTKLLLKLGYLTLEQLRPIVKQIGPAVDAYVGINTVPMTVENSDGSPTFEGRTVAGVSGIAIRDYALDFVQSMARLRLEENVPFDIVGMGGVTDPDSFLALFLAGASVVQSASGVNNNLLLAKQCIERFGVDLQSVSYPIDPAIRNALESRITSELLDADKALDVYALASRLPVPAQQTELALNEMLAAHRVRITAGVGDLARYKPGVAILESV